MARHGRMRISAERTTVDDFDGKLNAAIKSLETVAPDDWHFILNYIDSEASMPPNISNIQHPDAFISRKAAEKEGVAKIFYRLSLLSRRNEKEGK